MKIINNPANVPEETLEGFLQAYANDYVRVEGVKGIRVPVSYTHLRAHET